MEEKTNQNMNDWMNEVKTSGSIPENKGIIAAIQEPVEIETKFGKKKKISFIIDGSDGSSMNVGCFLPDGFPFVSPKSNLGKIMAQTGCKKLQELIGKEIEVVDKGDMMWAIKIDE